MNFTQHPRTPLDLRAHRSGIIRLVVAAAGDEGTGSNISNLVDVTLKIGVTIAVAVVSDPF
jgi:hypothetical protein